VTEQGLRNNVSVSLQYLAAWFAGNGAVAIFNLMEDAATAEISRAQLWLWLHRGSKLDDGRAVTEQLYRQIQREELAKLDGAPASDQLDAARALLDELVLSDQFSDFLTLSAYERLR
jgi:malate synthase